MAQLVKTISGLAIASCKTVNGLAIASVKTINDLDNTGGGASYILDEDWEGTGKPTSWVESGTIAPNYDDTGVTGAGPQCLTLGLSAQTGEVYFPFTAADAMNGFMRFKLNSYGTGTQTIASFQTSGASARGSLQITTSLQLRVLASGGTGNATTDVLSLGVWYYIWWEYIKASVSGNDAIMRAGFATTGTKPTLSASGAKSCASTNGTSTNQIARFYIGDAAASHTYNFSCDHNLLDDATIGDNP